jgi:hypothetical protein
VYSANNRFAGDYYVASRDLKEKQAYLMISFFDDELQIPDITTVVYLGKDIFGEGGQNHYFQEYSAFVNSSSESANMIEAPEDQLMNFFDLRGASQLLAYCQAQGDKKGA